MKISVMGTGMVGQTLGGKLSALGHDVMLAGREVDNEASRRFVESHPGARTGDFASAARFGEVVIFAVAGQALLAAASACDPADLAGKVVIDVTNPLQMVPGGLPTLDPALSNTTSAGEALQAALPQSRVVKTLNTMTARLMVDPARVPGPHDVFLCGNDAEAKAVVVDLLRSFGWTEPVDLGGIASALGMEGLMPFWLRMMQTLGTADFNYRIAR
ncbi:NAD(P)-binding domain-containing protein [Ciceribacter sp. L1K22]|uniref:NADPH-dependent F420 reductase n=1 Tax=Ciceribacter sp. L1K22 TaxID=2820275 RepID=UPI001ABE7F53|nr:NAD(P)-binding domain-containing protein [Ciceribacter sp. L1K22]MBO3760447.1 NAD(P)-binding domain-containing protein [Ciceribacter sp. L1K22]